MQGEAVDGLNGKETRADRYDHVRAQASLMTSPLSFQAHKSTQRGSHSNLLGRIPTQRLQVEKPV
jgi:hypothetical protein